MRRTSPASCAMSSGQRGGGGGLVWMAGTLGRASVARDSDEVDCPAHAVGSPGHAELPRTSSEAEGRPGPTSERGAAGPPTLSRRQNRMPGPQSAWGPRDGSPGTTNHGGRGIDAKTHVRRLGGVCRLCPPLLASCDRRGDALRRPAAVPRGILARWSAWRWGCPFPRVRAAVPFTAASMAGLSLPGMQRRPRRRRRRVTLSELYCQRRRRARASTRFTAVAFPASHHLHGLGRPGAPPIRFVFPHQSVCWVRTQTATVAPGLAPKAFSNPARVRLAGGTRPSLVGQSPDDEPKTAVSAFRLSQARCPDNDSLSPRARWIVAAPASGRVAGLARGIRRAPALPSST